jgi:hypothetical protein
MVSTVSQRQRLEWALSDAKLKMESAEAGSLWILKPSLTNKGAVRGSAFGYYLGFTRRLRRMLLYHLKPTTLL